MSTQLSTIPLAAISGSDELLGAATIAEICNVGRSTVYERLAKVPCEVDVSGARRWRLSALPADYRQRIELAKQIKGYARAEDIVDWKKRAEGLFSWTTADVTKAEALLWPKRKQALEEYYRSLEAGLPKGRAEERAIETFKALTGKSVTDRTIRNWIEPIERCGGPEHAPDVAYTQIGRREKKGAHVPQATIDYFVEMMCENQRKKFKAAYRKLMEQLENWRKTGHEDFAIPGYKTPPPNAKGKSHPFRWTYRYLAAPLRRPRNAVIVAATQGSIAAAELHAIVRRTRAEAKVGEFILFDDSHYDQKVNLVGLNSRATRPLGLDAMDYASACVFASAFKPALWDDEEKVRKMLREWDMVWFLVHALQTTGFRKDGTWLIVELGTAAIPEWLEKNLALVTGGAVRVWRSRTGGDPAFAGVFEGARKGNPRFKAALESSFNRRRNDMADVRLMPGQVGKDADHQPEEITGRDRYNRDILRAWETLPEDLRDELQFPYLTWSRFCEAATNYIEAINRDPEHELEGWKHRTVQEWRLDESTPWLPTSAFSSLPPERRALVENLLLANPNLVRERKRSRREEFELGRGDLVRLADWDVPQLLTNAEGKDFGRIRTVTRDGMFKFQDAEIDPYGEEFWFLAEIFDRAGHAVRLTEGSRYLTYLNPFTPDHLVVCRENGGYLGTARAISRARLGNAEEEAKLLALQRKLTAADRTDLQRIGADRIREQAEMIKTNAGIAAPRKGERAAQQKEAAASTIDKLYS
jgi:hypothetical protein